MNNAAAAPEDSFAKLSLHGMLGRFLPDLDRRAKRQLPRQLGVDAEDIALNAFMRATLNWQQPDQKFKGRSTPEFWRYAEKILRCKIIDYLRRRATVKHGGRQRTVSLHVVGPDGERVRDVVDYRNSSPCKAAARRELLLLAAIAKLPDDLREVIRFRFIKGLSLAETAKTLGITDIEALRLTLNATPLLEQYVSQI